MRIRSTEMNESVDNSNHSLSRVEQYFEQSYVSTSLNDSPSEKQLFDKIVKISLQSRLSFEKNPFEIYEQFRDVDPLIFQLATTVLSAPSTQVSVERAFSALKILISAQRNRLSEKSVEDILTISLNRELFSLLNFDELFPEP